MVNKRLPRRNCLYCGNECSRPEKYYCNNVCQQRFQSAEKIKKGTLGEQALRRWLLRNNAIQCTICMIKEWNGKDIPLIMDHIDGDHLNNKIENLRLICGNCDMQLPTYKNRNIGKGRKYRRERYAKGLSY